MAVHDNLKFGNFSEFQNVISDSTPSFERHCDSPFSDFHYQGTSTFRYNLV